MKTQVPDTLKSDVPSTTWGKVLTATPVAMTVIATMLAGLASSEMTEAGYARSLAAQQQSKAGDQWSYFQAKRLRSALQHSTLDVLINTADVHPLNLTALELSSASTNSGIIAALQKGEMPTAPKARPLDSHVQTALKAVEGLKTDAEITAAITELDIKTLADAVFDARTQAHSFDETTKPVNQAVEQLEKSLAQTNRALLRDYTAARLRYTAQRYDAEARLNQSLAYLVELQVHKSNQIAERHRRRSQRFFFGMLAAQAAVIVSTFSLAARKHSLLWSLAAIAGLASTGFAVWVYFYV